MAAFGLSSMYDKSMTYDEYRHVKYGRDLLRDKLRIFEDHAGCVPFTSLNVIPSFLLRGFNIKISEKLDIFLSRLPTVLFSLMLGCLIFLWTSNIFGAKAGIFGLLLYVFDPNILAHSQLVTSDMYAAFFLFLAVYLSVKFFHYPTFLNFIQSSCAAGLSFVAKHAIFGIGIYWLTCAIYITKKTTRVSSKKLLKGILIALLYLAVAILIVNICYLFRDTCMPFEKYNLRSTLLSSLRLRFPQLIIPLPRAFLETRDTAIFFNETCGGHGPPYLLGRLNACGWPYYFWVALFFKVPIPILILFILGFVILIKNVTVLSFEKAIILSLPIAFLLLFFPFSKNQVGMRNTLIIFPFCYMIISGVVSYQPFMRLRLAKPFIICMVIWHLVSSLSFYPHYLSYFNELIGNRKNMYKYLGDSNVDWGQDEYYLQRYLEKHRGEPVFLRPDGQVKGIVIVNINDLLGINDDDGMEQYKWLRENYEPAGRIAYSYLIYDTRDSR